MAELWSALDGIDPLLVWGLFPRLLGVVFLIAFASLFVQIVAVSGEHGMVPVRLRLSRVKRDFGWRSPFYFPTLLWIDSRDWALRTLPLVGVAAALLAIYGGPYGVYALPVCYLIYLSLDPAVGLVFPWDALLLEAGFFTLFLPPIHALPQLEAVAAPAPAIAWVYRLLVFRVIFGFGKLKFMGSTPDDLDYLKGFLVNQPLPSPLGWYGHALPVWVLKGAMIVMFLVEMVIPLAIFFPGPPAALAGIAIAGLMVGIWVSGNFGYFNVLMMVLCVTLLDSTTPAELDVLAAFQAGGSAIPTAVALVHTVGVLFAFPFNSFLANSWMYWPLLLRAPRWLLLPIDLYRLLHPLRWLHAYGVFPPKTPAGVKGVIVMEASWDGEEWHELRHPIAPTHPESPPKFVAPYHHRSDQAMVYETFGLNDVHLFTGVTAVGYPYITSYASPAQNSAQRLLEGSDFTRFLFRKGSLPEGVGPPKRVRIRTHVLERISIEEHRRTGRWWKRSYLGPHLPPTEKQDDFWDYVCPDPEVWHFDTLIWRRRSRLRHLIRRAKRGEAITPALVEGTRDITAEDVDRFWGEFLPATRAHARGDWAGLADVVAALRDRYSRSELYKFERIAGRLSVMLCTRMEPSFLHRLRRPKIPVTSYFHLGMLSHHIIGDGRAEFERVYADPSLAAEIVPKMTMASGGYLLAVFRYDAFLFMARKQRLLDAVLNATREGKTLEIPPFVVKLQGWARSLFGCIPLIEFIQTQFTEEQFQEPGAPETRPSFMIMKDGRTVISFEDRVERDVGEVGEGSKSSVSS